MRSLFSAMAKAHGRGENLVLCSIIESTGSAPRSSGAKLAYFQDGSFVGTVGGGALEYHALQLAKQALGTKTSSIHHFTLTPNAAADIGMICGGEVALHIAPISGDDRNFTLLVDAVLDQSEKNTDSWLLTRLDGDVELGFYLDGHGLFADKHADTDWLTPFLSEKPVIVRNTQTEQRWFCEPLTRAATVYVFGGGHVSSELVPLLTRVGFSVTVFEDRAQFCSQARFPTAKQTRIGSFSDISEQIAVTPRDYVVIMTRGHQADYEVLRQALHTKAAYIGMIGSRKKVAATRERLLADGFTNEDLSRIHAPIGLPIEAETPAEIAVSIAAELILTRAQLLDTNAR